MKPCFSIESITEGTGGHFYRYGYGYGCSLRVLGTGTGVGCGCWVRVQVLSIVGYGYGNWYWVPLLGPGTGVGYMFGCGHRTYVPYPCTVSMYRATVPMYGTHLQYHRTHRTHVPYPWTVPTVPTIRTQLATDLYSKRFFDIFDISLKLIYTLFHKKNKNRLPDRSLTGYV